MHNERGDGRISFGDIPTTLFSKGWAYALRGDLIADIQYYTLLPINLIADTGAGVITALARASLAAIPDESSSAPENMSAISLLQPPGLRLS